MCLLIYLFFRCYCVSVSESYGTTEVSGITTDNYTRSRVGKEKESLILRKSYLSYLSETKLVGWEEYQPTDNPPRGEIVVRSITMFAGYFKDETTTYNLPLPLPPPLF